MRIYLCEVCGAVLMGLHQLVLHFAEEHPDLLPGWYWVMRCEGRRPSLWAVYRELREAGLVRGGTR